MACCRRLHGKHTCCDHSKRSDTPVFSEARGCGGDCASVAPGDSPVFSRNLSTASAHPDTTPFHLLTVKWTFVEAQLSVDFLQRPPPAA